MSHEQNTINPASVESPLSQESRHLVPITSWDPNKGFGFVFQDGKKTFIHINTIDRLPDPTIPQDNIDLTGTSITFDPTDIQTDARGTKITRAATPEAFALQQIAREKGNTIGTIKKIDPKRKFGFLEVPDPDNPEKTLSIHFSTRAIENHYELASHLRPGMTIAIPKASSLQHSSTLDYGYTLQTVKEQYEQEQARLQQQQAEQEEQSRLNIFKLQCREACKQVGIDEPSDSLMRLMRQTFFSDTQPTSVDDIVAWYRGKKDFEDTWITQGTQSAADINAKIHETIVPLTTTDTPSPITEQIIPEAYCIVAAHQAILDAQHAYEECLEADLRQGVYRDIFLGKFFTGAKITVGDGGIYGYFMKLNGTPDRPAIEPFILWKATPSENGTPHIDIDQTNDPDAIQKAQEAARALKDHWETKVQEVRDAHTQYIAQKEAEKNQKEQLTAQLNKYKDTQQTYRIYNFKEAGIPVEEEVIDNSTQSYRHIERNYYITITPALLTEWGFDEQTIQQITQYLCIDKQENPSYRWDIDFPNTVIAEALKHPAYEKLLTRYFALVDEKIQEREQAKQSFEQKYAQESDVIRTRLTLLQEKGLSFSTYTIESLMNSLHSFNLSPTDRLNKKQELQKELRSIQTLLYGEKVSDTLRPHINSLLHPYNSFIEELNGYNSEMNSNLPRQYDSWKDFYRHPSGLSVEIRNKPHIYDKSNFAEKYIPDGYLRQMPEAIPLAEIPTVIRQTNEFQKYTDGSVCEYGKYDVQLPSGDTVVIVRAYAIDLDYDTTSTYDSIDMPRTGLWVASPKDIMSQLLDIHEKNTPFEDPQYYEKLDQLVADFLSQTGQQSLDVQQLKQTFLQYHSPTRLKTFRETATSAKSVPLPEEKPNGS